MKKLKQTILGVVLYGFCSVVIGQIPVQLYYPKPEAEFDERVGYPLSLLRLALKESPELAHIQLKVADMKMPRGRALKILENNLGIDIFWSIASEQRKADLRAIDYPIFQGLFGYRLLLINESHKNKFQNIENKSELQVLLAGLGHDWPDLTILQKNGYAVQGSSSYAGLFDMLRRGRVDYLPRSIFEIQAEFEHFVGDGLVIEPNIALHYPVIFHFFVAKENELLASKIEASLNALDANGKTKVLFDALHQHIIEEANLEKRTVFELELNPK